MVGGALAQAGQSARLEATLRAWSSGDEGVGQILVGGVFAIVGLVLLIVGVYRMAASVDMLASANGPEKWASGDHPTVRTDPHHRCRAVPARRHDRARDRYRVRSARSVAGALVIAGVGFLAVGIHRLASNVDIAANAAHYAATVLDDSDDEPTARGL